MTEAEAIKKLPLITLQEAREHDAEWSDSNFEDSLQEFGKKIQRKLVELGWRPVKEK